MKKDLPVSQDQYHLAKGWEADRPVEVKNSLDQARKKGLVSDQVCFCCNFDRIFHYNAFKLERGFACSYSFSLIVFLLSVSFCRI